jgi:hypothetical protein
MKVFVISDENGKVIGSVRAHASASKDVPSAGRPIPTKGQQVHEVELPSHLHNTTSIDELHRELAKLIKKQ